MIWSMDHCNGTRKGDVYVPRSLSALLCKPSYWKQEVGIKISVGMAAVANSTAISETEPFTEFNGGGGFENAVLTGRQALQNTLWDTLSQACVTLAIFQTNFLILLVPREHSG